jgi:F-type H+-transporting ATPase subunit epsilon
MATIKFELVSPERVLISDDVEHVVLPGSEGELGVLPGHAPVVVALKAGMITVIDGGSSKKLFVKGGFAEVNPEALTVLAEHAFDPADADKSMIAQLLSIAELELSEAMDDEAQFMAQAAVDELRALAA